MHHILEERFGYYGHDVFWTRFWILEISQHHLLLLSTERSMFIITYSRWQVIECVIGTKF